MKIGALNAGEKIQTEINFNTKSREISYHMVGSDDNLEDILLRSLRGAEVLI